MSETRGGLRSLFLDHLFSKLLAVALALVTVYLIEQELSGEVDWVDRNRRIPVLLPGQSWDGDPREARVVLRADPGVLITDAEPTALKVRIAGPENRKDDFERDPVVYVDVKREWTSEEWEVATHSITETDFELFGRGVKITLAEPLKVKVDFEEKKSVPVTVKGPTPSKLPAGHRFDRDDTVLEPAEVVVIGPRSTLKAFDAAHPLELELRDQPLYVDGKRYPVQIPKSSARLLRFEPGTRINALVALSLEQLMELDLGEMDVHWAVLNENLTHLQSGSLQLENVGTTASQRAAVVVEGRPAIVARYSDPAELSKLRASVYLLADPNTEIAESFGKVKDATISVRVFGLPEGLKVRRTEPDQLYFKIKKPD